jgi:hypothetical protein
MRVSILLACGGLFSACGTSGATEPVLPRSDVRLIRAPAGTDVDDPTWVPQLRRLVVRGDAGGSLLGLHLATVNLQTGKLQRLRGVGDPVCEKSFQLAPRALPDGRLVYISNCGHPTQPEEAVTLRVYDGVRADSERLVPYNLPYGARDFDYADLSRGVLNDGSGLYERLQWLRPEGLDPVDAPFSRAGNPSWSPDGRFIAVDAAPSRADAEGHDRLDLERNLYMLEVATGRLQVLVEKLDGDRTPARSAWSPDGRLLVLSMNPNDGPDGVWVVEVATGRKALLIESDHVGSATFLPGGEVAVSSGIFSHDRETSDVGLYVFALPKDLSLK